MSEETKATTYALVNKEGVFCVYVPLHLTKKGHRSFKRHKLNLTQPSTLTWALVFECKALNDALGYIDKWL